MKRSEALDLIEKAIYQSRSKGGDTVSDFAKAVLDRAEELGMIPPVQSPSMVEDTYNGGLKHGPAQRVWDKE